MPDLRSTQKKPKYIWIFFRFFVILQSEMNQATRDYIHCHAEDDVRQLALRGTKDPEVNLPFALEQIAGRQKARIKIPSWAALDDMIYPPHLSMEQCSSEQTARYKASVSCPINHRLFVDLTGGFGVDFSFMAKNFDKAVYVEREPSLCAISSENFKTIGLEQAEVVCADGIDYLHQIEHADLIYIDPARRNEHGGRTYDISDCTPNVLELVDELTRKADYVMLKLSPMLDWRKAVADIGCVCEVHIVSVDNECKELLVIMNSELIINREAKPIKVICVNLMSTGGRDVFCFPSIAETEPNHINNNSLFINHYLYEPNASIMKAGCFDQLAERFAIQQLDRNSHLFVSETSVKDFPGRQFVIEKTTSMNKRELKEALQGIKRANIAVRNFPLSAADLRKRLKLQDGGDIYIFATTVAGAGHQLFICRKKVKS